jgi:hypothetical protein
MSAERIYKELIHEFAGTWYVSDQFGKKIMVKAPSNLLKAIITGCRVSFLFGKNNRNIFPLFHTGIRIYDDPVHFASVSYVQLFRDEHRSLRDIMQEDEMHIYLHDELNACVAQAKVKLDPIERKKVIALQGNLDDLYAGSYNGVAAKSLDCFDYTFDATKSKAHTYEIEVLAIDGQFSNWEIVDNRFVGLHEIGPVIIDDDDEGVIFERQIWAPLQSLFHHDIYRQPQIADKYGYRELTDIFAFYEYGIFLVESKALALLNPVKERDMDRKVKGLQKQIIKGISQLVGAAKKIAENTPVYDVNKLPVAFDHSKLPHCIVLVSELLPFGDWKAVEMKMFDAMIEQPMYLNVMDLSELMTYIGYARGSKEHFDVFLMDRVKLLIKHQSIHIKAARDSFYQSGDL